MLNDKHFLIIYAFVLRDYFSFCEGFNYEFKKSYWIEEICFFLSIELGI